MAKQLAFTDEARKKLKNGIDIMANAVKTALGPKGRNVALDKKFGSPTITHDGVTVAREVELDLLGHRDAVVGHCRGAVLLVERDVAALRTERGLDGVSEDVDAVFQ